MYEVLKFTSSDAFIHFNNNLKPEMKKIVAKRLLNFEIAKK